MCAVPLPLRLTSCAALADGLEREISYLSPLRPRAAALATTLREIADAESRRLEVERLQRIVGGRTRVRRGRERAAPWLALALEHAKKLRAVTPEISRQALARKLKAALGDRLPAVVAIALRLKAWEASGELARRAGPRLGRPPAPVAGGQSEVATHD